VTAAKDLEQGDLIRHPEAVEFPFVYHVQTTMTPKVVHIDFIDPIKLDDGTTIEGWTVDADEDIEVLN
jgi:hypothetical protein